MAKIILQGMKRIFSSLSILFSVLIIHAQSIDNNSIKIVQTLNLINSYYVDTVNSSHLAETAIKAMLKELDPHCSYISAADVLRSHEGLEGNFEGIGVSYMMINDTITIDQTISGCPAERVGVLPGDKITHVDGKLIAGNNTKLNDIPKFIRGPKGSKVVITVVRQGEKHPIVFNIIRDKIPINSVDAAFFAAPGVGYVKLNSFSLTTPDEFTEALRKLSKISKIQSLIIDLQSNGGGIMNSAVDIVSRFVPRHTEVVSVRGVHIPTSSTLSSGYTPSDIPLYVLIDEYSASASEIVAGALQDWDRATIVGRRSFGKGLVQRPIGLQDGSEVRLTIARYYTPSGRNIQKPYDSGTDKYFKDIESRYKHGEMINSDSVQFPDSLKYYTLKKHRVVYGGGGIFPDIFVPLDTTKATKLYRQIVSKGALSRGTKTYTDKNRKRLLREFDTFEKFEQSFDETDKIEKAILKEADTEKIKYTESDVEETRQLLRLQARALVAQSLYGPEYYFRVTSSLNDALQTTIKYIR